jgi:L-iditol 2-dehydrogenase
LKFGAVQAAETRLNTTGGWGTMKVAIYYRNDNVRVQECPIPELGPGDLLVKTEACGLCSGETMEWYLSPRAPKVLGHEPTGVVVAVGPGVTDFKEGDRVFVHHHVPCMSCHYCQRGLYTMCDHFGATHIDPGGFAEYFRVPDENARFDTLILPDNISFEEGTIIEPMACTLRGVKQTRIRPGDTVAIVGLGFMGVCYLQLIKLSPAGKIFALDFSTWRLEKARALGATHTLNPKLEDPLEKLKDLNEGRGADVVFVSAPSLDAWQSGLSLCAKGAHLHFGAPPPPEAVWKLNPQELYFGEIQINATYSASHVETRAVLDLLAAKRVDAQAMISHRFGLDGVGEAIRLLLAADKSLKSLIMPALTHAQ